MFADGTRQGLPETGPAGATVELGRRREQVQGAACAGEVPGTMLIVQRARKWPFSALLAQHGVLLGRQKLPPLSIRMHDLECFRCGGLTLLQAG